MRVSQNDLFSKERRISIESVKGLLPTPDGKRFANVFTHGTLQVEIFAPLGRDTQTPHTRDEAYFVVQGRGTFVNGDARMPCQPGDFLFAAAGEVHRFEDFSDDFYVWVVFYGPEGGEQPRG